MNILLNTKLLASVLVLFLMLLGGCGEQQNDAQQPDEQTEQTAPESTSESSDVGDSDVDPADFEASEPSEWEDLKVEASACGETMAKYIDLINQYSAAYNAYAANPNDAALEARVEQLRKTAEPLEKEINAKGPAFYTENYAEYCWETYGEAVQRLSYSASKAAGKMLEQKMPEIQKQLEAATQQLDKLKN